MPIIKLYTKTCCMWKSKTKETAHKEIDEFFKVHIKHEIQRVGYSIIPTKRKRKPIDVEISYYDFDTIQQIINDKKGEIKC